MINILLTTYNGAAYLREQIESILSQTYENWHLFIFDDKSTDNTLAIAEEYLSLFPNKITLCVNESATGSSAANFMLSLKKIGESDYTMFADQDDVWKSDKIEKSLKEIIRIESTSKNLPILVHTDLVVVNSKLETLNESFIKNSKFNPTVRSTGQLLVTNNITGCTVIINNPLKELLMSVPENRIDAVLMHDYFAGLICSLKGKIGFIESSTILYRQHENNQVGAKKIGIGFFMNKLFNINEELIKLHKKQVQARLLLEILDLDSDEKQIVADFIDFSNRNIFERWKLMRENNYYSQGFIRKKMMAIVLLFFGGKI